MIDTQLFTIYMLYINEQKEMICLFINILSKVIMTKCVLYIKVSSFRTGREHRYNIAF